MFLLLYSIEPFYSDQGSPEDLAKLIGCATERGQALSMSMACLNHYYLTVAVFCSVF